MVKRYKIKILKDTEKCKTGEIVEATKKNAESYVSQGYAEYISEPTKIKIRKQKKELVQIKQIPIDNKEQQRIKEGKWLLDKEILDKKGDVTWTAHDIVEYKLNPENVLKWKEINDRKKLVIETRAKIEDLARRWDDERGECIQELKLLVSKDFTKKELEEWVTEERNKLKEIQELKSEQKKEVKKESYSNIKEEYLDLIRDKKWGEASELLVTYIKNNNHIYTTKDDTKSEIWIYKEGIYVPQGRCEIKEILFNLLGKWYSIYVFNNVIAKIEASTYIEPKNFFTINYIDELPVQNGILNINTRKIIPFNPNRIFFNKLPVTYNPNAKCPMIDKFLGEVFTNEDDKKVFYELGGFSLLKEYKFEKAFMFVGNGRNGKGKTIDLLKKVIGGENCYSLSLAALESSNPDVHQLFGKMVNLAGDISSTDLKDTSLFKGLTGRDLITAKRKFLSALTFENYAKFIFACNELPMVYDMSKGFWDRWILLEFPYYFADKDEFEKASEDDKILFKWKLRDEDIINKITTQEELSGLLNEFLNGLDRLLIQRKFSNTKGSEEVKNTWIRKSNSFMAFCMDNLEEDYEGKITKKELRRRYLQYCKLHKVIGKNDYIIKKILQENFGITEEKSQLFGDIQEHVWVGIKFKKIQGIHSIHTIQEPIKVTSQSSIINNYG